MDYNIGMFLFYVLLLAALMFAIGVAGVLFGVALAKSAIYFIISGERYRYRGRQSSCHERQALVERGEILNTRRGDKDTWHYLGRSRR